MLHEITSLFSVFAMPSVAAYGQYMMKKKTNQNGEREREKKIDGDESK